MIVGLLIKCTPVAQLKITEVIIGLTEAGRLTRFSSRVWLNSRLMTL